MGFYDQSDEIHEFCQLKYKTRFPQMKKADVNGETAIPLFKYLKEEPSRRLFNPFTCKDIFNFLLIYIRLYVRIFVKFHLISCPIFCIILI